MTMNAVRPHRFYRAIPWSLTVLFVLSCVFPASSPAQTLPTQPPGMLQTVIVQTGAAAQTRTATFAPPTATNSITPTLTRSTPTITATVTPTFFFSLFTETLLVIPTQTGQVVVNSGGSGSGGGSSGAGGGSGDVPPTTDPRKFKTPQPWSCLVVSRVPGKGFEIKPEKSFTVAWTIQNTGTKTWTANTIDFIYQSGYRHEGRKIQDLGGTVGPGGKVTVKVLIVAPKKEGSYNVIWALMVGNNPFCHLKTTFEVKE
jgi:hypothetical protein